MLVSWPCVFRETGFDFKHFGIQDHPNHEEMNPSRHNFNTRHGQLQIDWRGLLGIEAWGRAKKKHHHSPSSSPLSPPASLSPSPSHHRQSNRDQHMHRTHCHGQRRHQSHLNHNHCHHNYVILYMSLSRTNWPTHHLKHVWTHCGAHTLKHCQPTRMIQLRLGLIMLARRIHTKHHQIVYNLQQINNINTHTHTHTENEKHLQTLTHPRHAACTKCAILFCSRAHGIVVAQTTRRSSSQLQPIVMMHIGIWMGGAQALIAPAGAQNPHALHVGHFAAIANLVCCCYFACSCASLRFWHPAPLASMALMLATVRCLRLRPWPNERGALPAR